MNSVKVKQIGAAIWLAIALTFGVSLISTQLGLDTVPTAHACATGNSGGACY